MWIKQKSRKSSSRVNRMAPLPKPLAEFEKKLHKATSAKDDTALPNVSVIAADAHGKILHTASSGIYTPQSSSPKSETSPAPKQFTPETVCWIASCTKLMTSIACLQCVEKNLLTLDTPISNILPELSSPQILISIDTETGPKFKPSTRKITLRNLLTHSSGIGYEFTHPKLFVWRKWYNRQSAENKAKSRSQDAALAYQVPLLFEPDEGWLYGYGIDWAGVAVSRVTGLSLGEYMKKHIWDPLGMKDTTFDIATRPDLVSRMPEMVERDLETGLIANMKGSAQQVFVKESGGGGALSTASDYIKVLTALLRNNGTLLRPSTVDLMFSPNLATSKHLEDVHSNPLSYGLAGNIPQGTSLDFGLGGILNLSGMDNTGRSGGRSMQWGGLPNLFWWINREDGICGCYFGQLLPAGDVKSFEMYVRYEKAVNEVFAGGRAIKGRL